MHPSSPKHARRTALLVAYIGCGGLLTLSARPPSPRRLIPAKSQNACTSITVGAWPRRTVR